MGIQGHKPKLTAGVNSGAGGKELAIMIPLHSHGGIAGWPNLGLKVGPLSLIDGDIVQWRHELRRGVLLGDLLLLLLSILPLNMLEVNCLRLLLFPENRKCI